MGNGGGGPFRLVCWSWRSTWWGCACLVCPGSCDIDLRRSSTTTLWSHYPWLLEHSTLSCMHSPSYFFFLASMPFRRILELGAGYLAGVLLCGCIPDGVGARTLRSYDYGGKDERLNCFSAYLFRVLFVKLEDCTVFLLSFLGTSP
jgi:hypothetical protein